MWKLKLPLKWFQNLVLQYSMCGSFADRYQSMRPYIKIYNNGEETVAMSDLKVRYYYTKEGIAEETLMCFYTAIGATNISAEFYPELGYADVGFTTGAGKYFTWKLQRSNAAGTEKGYEWLL